MKDNKISFYLGAVWCALFLFVPSVVIKAQENRFITNYTGKPLVNGMQLEWDTASDAMELDLQIKYDQAGSSNILNFKYIEPASVEKTGNHWVAKIYGLAENTGYDFIIEYVGGKIGNYSNYKVSCV